MLALKPDSRYRPDGKNPAWLLLLLLLFSPLALAQGSVPEAPGSSASAIVQMLGGLLAILGILFAAAWFLRRLNGGKPFGHGGPMKIVGGLMLGARERIVLVEVGDSWLVVGVVPGQIKTLHRLPKAEIPAASSEKPFGQWLKQMSERGNEAR